MRIFVVAAACLAIACSSSASTPPPGSSDLDAGGAETSTPATVLFHEHVEPIVQKGCQDCHHTGGIAPFPLVTWADTKRFGLLVADKVKSREMPPWGAATTEECKPRFPHRRDLSLSQSEIDTIVKWVEQGTPEGDPKKAPPPRTFAPQGLPAATHTLATPKHDVQPGSDELRCFVVDPKLTEDTWVEGTNVIPGNNAVVHHVIVYQDPMRQSLAKADASGSYPCFGGSGVSGGSMVLAWAPGVPAAEFPANTGLPIKKGTLLVVQMHYHPGAETQNDTTKVELRTTSKAPQWEALISFQGNRRSAPELLPGDADPASGPAFLIPAGAKKHVEAMDITLPAIVPELRIASVGAHMHWIAKDMKVEIERPDARGKDPKSECLLQTPRYDFNWQRGYAFEVPSIEDLPTVKGGDRIKVRCTYDNSMDNPYLVKALAEKKLTSPIDVTLGEETLDEMCLATFVTYRKVR